MAADLFPTTNTLEHLIVELDDDGSYRRTSSAQIGVVNLSPPLELPREDGLFLFHNSQVQVSTPSCLPRT